ncbi:MAG: hypothetical protein QM744_10595 [Mesorhizobium sp.]
MPNVKIFVDETSFPAVQEGLKSVLPDLRAQLCTALAVDLAATQFAVIPVVGLPDQPPINVEMHILPRPERTREAVLAVARQTRESVRKATGQHVAVRIATLDAETYVALK